MAKREAEVLELVTEQPRKPRSDTSHVDWKTAEVLYISGQLDLGEIAERYGIPYTAIQARSKRGQWAKYREASLERLNSGQQKKVMLPVKRDDLGQKDGETCASSSISKGVNSETSHREVAGDAWALRQIQHREIAYSKAHNAIAGANLAPPSDWKEFEIADRIARKAAGLDEEKSGGITVNFAMGFLNGNAS